MVVILKMGERVQKVKRKKYIRRIINFKNDLKMQSNCTFLDCQKHQTEEKARCVCDHIIASSVLHQCISAGRLRGYLPLREYLVTVGDSFDC